MTDDNGNSGKIEDILKSVRNIIDNHNNKVAHTDIEKEVEKEVEKVAAPRTDQLGGDNILELTSVIEEKDLNDCLISDQVKQHAKEEINKFISAFKQEYTGKYQSLEFTVNDLMRPLIKDWLNNNLPTMVERIVSEEIKKIIPK